MFSNKNYHLVKEAKDAVLPSLVDDLTILERSTATAFSSVRAGLWNGPLPLANPNGQVVDQGEPGQLNSDTFELQVRT